MTKPKMTKTEMLAREETLAEVLFNALATPNEEYARAWTRRANQLSEGMPQAAIKRARRRAHKAAEDCPPGYVKAMDAMALFDSIIRRRKITKRDENALWGAVAQLCMFQLGARKGSFYEAALDFRLLAEAPQGHAVPLMPGERISITRIHGCGNPDCHSCRPRKAEELN